MARYTHLTAPLPSPDARYNQMLIQRETANERHHILKEFIAGHGWLDHPGLYAFGTPQFIFPHAKPPIKPTPVSKIECNPWRERESDLPPFRDVWGKRFEKSWELRERGILHALEDMKKFMVVAGMMGLQPNVSGWPALFQELREAETPKSLIPCLFFNTEEGCLDSTCEFVHDRKAAEAARKQTLEARRESFNKSTPKQIEDLQLKLARHLEKVHKTKPAFEKLMKQIEDQVAGATVICAYPKCRRKGASYEAGDNMITCEGCGWAKWCSARCEKSDDSRHYHQDRCGDPISELIEDNSYWSKEDGIRLDQTDSGRVAFYLRAAGEMRREYISEGWIPHYEEPSVHSSDSEDEESFEEPRVLKRQKTSDAPSERKPKAKKKAPVKAKPKGKGSASVKR